MTNNDIYSQLGRIVALGGAGKPNPPPTFDPPSGFIWLLGADGAFLRGADGAYLYGVAS